MNENTPRQPDNLSIPRKETSLAPESAAALHDQYLEEATDAPLVDAALEEVAQRDDSLGAFIGQDVEAMQAEIESLKGRAGEVSSQALVSAKSTTATTARSARRIVRQNPLTALGIAATVGYLLGLTAWR